MTPPYLCIDGSPNVQPGDTDSLTCQLCGDLIRGVCSHDRIGRRCHWGCAAKYAERKDEEMLAAAQRRYECYVVEGWSGRRTPLVLHWIGNVPDLLHNPRRVPSSRDAASFCPHKERLQSFIRGLIGLQIRMDPGILEWPQRIDILEWPQRIGHHSSALNHSGIAVSTRPTLGDMGVRSHAKDGHKVATSA